jgi:hypothetical protein
MRTVPVAILVSLIFFGLSAAVAQRPEAVITTCTSSTRGSPSCPNYIAPAATAVPRAAMDGSMNVAAQTSTTLFNGAVPPNAFMVRAYTGCVVNDNGPAGVNNNTSQKYLQFQHQPMCVN